VVTTVMAALTETSTSHRKSDEG